MSYGIGMEYPQHKRGTVFFHRTLDYINPEDFDEGVQLVIVFRRRILNAILTVYLPTILVLTIVYATNFFKGIDSMVYALIP